MKPIPLIIGTLLFGGIVHFTLLLYKKYIKVPLPVPNNGTPVTDVKPIVSKQELDEFSQEFSKIADKFESLYDELHAVCQSDKDAYCQKEFILIITEWELKIKCYSNGPVMTTWSDLIQKHFNQQWFEDDTQKAPGQQRAFLVEWYQLLLNIGIEQDNRKFIKVEDYTLHHTYIIRGLYEIGDELEIDPPCWMLNNKCVERGYANIIRKQE